MSGSTINEANDLTKTQQWLRGYSERLISSFKSSSLIKHNVTKGESREKQIMDVLSLLLPTKLSIKQNVVIVDSKNIESPKFDGVLVDFTLWPRLFVEDDTTCAMLESIHVAIEIKSSLDKSELEDIFCKSGNLRKMTSCSNKSPLVTAFAYECSNPNLSFFDFSTLFLSSPSLSPSLLCVLNQNLFGLAKIEADKIVPIDEPLPDAMPVLFSPGQDTLLVYLYFLSRWIATETEAARLFRRYSDNVFQNMECFHFDNDFLNAIKSDNLALLKARKCFERKAGIDITKVYIEARKQLNLPGISN